MPRRALLEPVLLALRVSERAFFSSFSLLSSDQSLRTLLRIIGNRQAGAHSLFGGFGCQTKYEIKTIKSVNDKRGSKTVGLHLKAKEFRMLHPELSYRNCLIEVSKQVSKPEEPIEFIDEIPEPYIEVFEDVINI